MSESLSEMQIACNIPDVSFMSAYHRENLPIVGSGFHVVRRSGARVRGLVPCTITVAMQNRPPSRSVCRRRRRGRVGVVEPRGELRLAQEALEDDIVVAQPL